jgi:hypothetical protein
MTDNKFIQSVLAHSIMDDQFMNGLAGKDKIPNTDILLSKQTVKGLKYFSGFIAKVQHNFLWNDFMLTRKMLIRQQIEIEVFTAYLAQHQNNKRNKIAELNKKINLFVSFLKNYLQHRNQRRYRLVYNILLHEEAMFALKLQSNLHNPLEFSDLPTPKISSNRRPVLCGAVRQVMMCVPPQSIAECFKENTDKLLRVRRRSYCYWYDPYTQSFRILEIPVIVRRVLNVIDNKKKVKDIEQYFSGKLYPADIRLVLDHLLQMKMISLN